MHSVLLWFKKNRQNRQYSTDVSKKKLVIAFVMSTLDCNTAFLYKIAKIPTSEVTICSKQYSKIEANNSKQASIEQNRKDLH